MRSEQGHVASAFPSTAEELLAAVRFGVPEPVPTHVERQRLLHHLADADGVPLVLVSGPAGTGKTSLVADWVRRRGGGEGPTGWVTFEDGETTFWEHVVACLARLGLDLPDEVAQVRGDAVLGIQRLAALAAAVTDAPERFTVVLDGYELVSLELAHEVDFLLKHTLGHLCLVFVGRVDPVLPLYRYRLTENLLEVRAADLAFTDEEAAALLRSLGVRLPDEPVHELNQRIKGWVAGLRFAARALVGHPHPERSVATVVGQTGDINEYLLGEVLEAQSPEVRRFLLDTCVPDVLCPELVEELTGPRGMRTLDDLARSDAFIEVVPDQPEHYRYYPFFRDLLRAQLAYESPERTAELHRRTAEWLDRHGLPEQAIAHLAGIPAWDEVANELVGRRLVGRLLLAGDDDRLVRTACDLPAHLQQGAAHVVRAAVRLRVGDGPGSAEELIAARRTTEPEQEGTLVCVDVLDAVRAARTEAAAAAATAVENAERALTVETRRGRTPEEGQLYALVQLGKGVAMLRLGDLKRARRAFTTAIGLDASRDFPVFRAECLGHLAVMDALEGYLARARRTAAESLAVADNAGVPPEGRSPAALVALACVALEQYELAAARDHVASAVVCRSLPGDPVCRPVLEGVVAGLERAGGHLQPALARLDAAAARASDRDPWLADYLRLEAAKLSVASGRADHALAELAEVGERDIPEISVVSAAAYAEQGRNGPAEESLDRARKGQAQLTTKVAALLVEVLQESRRRAPGRARVALDRSLRLAAPEELRRPFREAGPSVQRLLAADQALLREHPWLNHSGAGNGRGGTHPRGAVAAPPHTSGTEVVETLTPKELEVLGHLEELLSTEEIAEKMFVSVNTVRTHVRSILRKLGVSRRNAAVRKARALGLFDA